MILNVKRQTAALSGVGHITLDRRPQRTGPSAHLGQLDGGDLLECPDANLHHAPVRNGVGPALFKNGLGAEEFGDADGFDAVGERKSVRACVRDDDPLESEVFEGVSHAWCHFRRVGSFYLDSP